MAGTLPDLPGHRFKLDEDGTTLFALHGPTGSIENKTEFLPELMDFDGSSTYTITRTASGVGSIHWFLFPEPRTITAAWVQYRVTDVTANTWAYSTNTTTGTDGTWTNFTGSFSSAAMSANWRSGLTTVNLTNVRGLRCTTNNIFSTAVGLLAEAAIYGYLPTTAADRLTFWDPTANTVLPANGLDMGDITNGTTAVTPKTFRVKNLSATKTANNVHVRWDATKQPAAAWTFPEVELSLDGTAWFDEIDLGNLAPTAISSVVYVRPTVPTTVDFFARTAWLTTTNDGFTV